MINPDAINGFYEVCGALVVWLSVIQIRKNKVVKGYNPMVTWFFATWGLWNLYYYYHLDQPISWYGGMALFVVNCIWLGHLYYYLWQKPKGYYTSVNDITRMHFTYVKSLRGYIRDDDSDLCSLNLTLTANNENPVWVVDVTNAFLDFKRIENIDVTGLVDKPIEEVWSGRTCKLDYELYDSSLIVIKWPVNSEGKRTTQIRLWTRQ